MRFNICPSNVLKITYYNFITVITMVFLVFSSSGKTLKKLEHSTGMLGEKKQSAMPTHVFSSNFALSPYEDSADAAAIFNTTTTTREKQ